MPSRLYIPQPFASGDGSVVADLTPIDTISGNKVGVNAAAARLFPVRPLHRVENL